MRRKKKKSKIKKPKHLKRKLEQASNENGEAKEVIQKQIEQFEARKKLYSKRKDNTKRRKTTHAESRDGSNNKRNDDEVVSRHTRIDGSCTPLERSKTAESKNPTLIPDDDFEMTRQKETVEPNGSKGLSTSTVDAEPEEDSSDGDSDDENDDEDGNEAASSMNIVDKTSDQSSADSNDNYSDDSSSESDDDSDDDESDDEPMQQRQRGRRRRGRQDTAKKVEEMEAVENSKADPSSGSKSKSKNEDDDNKNEKKRYCIGRKPVTDFVIGQSYPAKVVYVKPFGVFFDIGCHSDAFCHVSRLSDEFVESPESKFKEGDEVPKARIVEIDRKQKRITVSLQSDVRRKDELQSIEARKSRKEKRKTKSKNKSSIDSSGHDLSKNYSGFNNESASISRAQTSSATDPKSRKDESMMTPAELKRARKLARRAERRAQAEQQVENS